MMQFVLNPYAKLVNALPFGSGFILPEMFLTLGIGVMLVLTLLADKKKPEENDALLQVSLIFVLGALALLTMNFWVLDPMVHEDVLFGTLTSDLFGYLMRIVLLLGAAVTLALSNRFLEQHTRIIGDFYILVMGATLGGMFLATACDLIAVFVGLETLSITSYILAGYLRKTARSAEASFKYLIFGGMGSAIFLFGVSLVYGLAGSTSFAEIAMALQHFQGMTHPTLLVLMLMIFSALAFKLSSAPFHMWTPDVYDGAPTPVSAFLSVVSKAAALAVTIRMLLVMFAGFAMWPLFWGILAVLSMTIGNFVALKQRDVKRLLAYSTIAHAGYMLLGLVVATPLSIGGVLYYMLAYAFMNLGAFAAVIHFGLLTRTNDIAAYSGLVHKRPGLVVGFSVCLLSLTGIPFTSGFFAKFFLFQTVALASPVYLWLVVVALINSTVSLAYYLNMIRLMVVKEPSPAVRAIPDRGPAPWPLSTALAFCTAVTLILGIFAQPFFMFSTMSAEQLAHERPMMLGQTTTGDAKR